MAKQLFNSTEKSNFILNLTEEQYSKLASYGLMTACLATSLFTLIPELSYDASYAISTGGLSIAGVICMVLALISAIKKYIDKKALFSVGTFIFIMLWCIVSLINSYSKSVGLYGFAGRGEGLLAFVFYCCFFVTALSVKRKKYAERVISTVVACGLINAVFAVIQMISGKFSKYRYIKFNMYETRLETNTNFNTDNQINAVSGLAQSPIFLATILSLALTASLTGFIMSKNKKKGIFCIVSSCIFSFVMVFTYSFAGICGLAIGVLSAVITVFVAKEKKLKLLSVLSVIVPAVVGIMIVNAGLVGNISSYKLYDGYTLWWADSYMRLSSSGNYNPDVLDISNTKDVYLYLNDKAVNIMEKNMLTGTGPDQLAYPQIYTDGGLDLEQAEITDVLQFNKGTFDRVYNEYLYTGATRGLPSLIALVVLLISVLRKGIKKVKENRDSETVVSSFMITLCGVLVFFVSCTNITFSPVFWTVAGLLMCDTESNISEKNK